MEPRTLPRRTNPEGACWGGDDRNSNSNNIIGVNVSTRTTICHGPVWNLKVVVLVLLLLLVVVVSVVLLMLLLLLAMVKW